MDQVPVEGRPEGVERRPNGFGGVKRLRWLGVILPVAFILSLEAFRYFIVEGATASPGNLLLAAVTVGAIVLFASEMFQAIETTQRQLIRQNRELTAINAVSTAVQGELGIEVILDAALDSVIDSSGATEAVIRVFPPGGDPDGEGGLERRRVAAPHASPRMEAGSLVPHLIDIPLSTGTTVLGRMQLHLPQGTAEPDLLATATLNNIGHQLAASIQISQFVVDLKRRQREGHGFYSVLLQISNQAELADILSEIVGHARDLLGADEAAMCLSEASASAMQLDVPAGAVPALTDGTIYVGGDAACRTRLTADVGLTLEAPIRSPDGNLGDLCLGRRAGAPFTGRDRGFLVTMSDLASIAITSARTREGERQGAIVTERERIAREMHDSLAQILGVTHLRLVALEGRPELAEVPRVLTELADLASLTEEAYRDVREAILGLREAGGVERDFIDSLRAYLEKYSHQSGIPATLETSLDGELALPPRSELQIIRVVQEALTNVRKHGSATAVTVRIGDGPEGTTIVIEDDGHGFDVAATLLGGQGFGLHTMRERMELVGGTLTIDSAPGSGTRIIAMMPRLGQAGTVNEANEVDSAGDDSHPHPAGR